MANPPSDGQRHWTASSWRSLIHPEVVRAPSTFGVVILGDARSNALLVTSGVIQAEVRRLFNDTRSAERGAACFRFIEAGTDQAAERLGGLVLRELRQTQGDHIAWKEFPAPPPFAGGGDSKSTLGHLPLW